MTWLACGIASRNLGQKVGRARPATKMGTKPKRMGRKLHLMGIQQTQLKTPKIKRNEQMRERCCPAQRIAADAIANLLFEIGFKSEFEFGYGFGFGFDVGQLLIFKR